MKKSEWNEALNHIDDDIVANFVAQKEILQKKKKAKKIWLRVCAIAACLAIVLGTMVSVPMLIRRYRGDMPWDDSQSSDTVGGENSYPPFNDGYGQPPNNDCPGVPTDTDEYEYGGSFNEYGNILKAWSGELTKEKLKWAIEEYRKNYTNIVLEEDTDLTVSFEVDFPAASCSVTRVSSVDDSDSDCEWEEGVLNFYLDAELDNKTVTVSILDFDSNMEKYPVVSYVVRVKDIKGEEIHYYFRVDYSNLTNTSNQERKSYKVKISKPADVRIENELKASYAEGEVVTVKLKRIDGHYDFIVNGVNQSYDESTDDYLVYNFVMPAQDVTVNITAWYVIYPIPPQDVESTIEIEVVNGVAYFNQLKNTSAILQTDDGDILIEDNTFIEKLGAAINGKSTIKCDCETIYYVEIDSYFLYFHAHDIAIGIRDEEYSSSVSYSVYTVECTEKEMNELCAILEATKQSSV